VLEKFIKLSKSSKLPVGHELGKAVVVTVVTFAVGILTEKAYDASYKAYFKQPTSPSAS
jgi:hypothetical protein